MEIPFSIKEFLDVFKNYNEAVFPAQIIAYIIGLIAVIFLFKRSKISGFIINGILALFWIWIGIVYHFIYFSAINDAAILFGIAFIIQGLLFLFWGAIFRKVYFSIKPMEIKLHKAISLIMISYAMIIYPLLNEFLGHSYPHSPIFGLAPCPTVIFTFGILMLSVQKVPVFLLIIPFLWSLGGFSAAVNLGMIEDYGLVIAGITGLVIIIKKNKTFKN